MAGFCAIVLIVLPGWTAGVIAANLRSYRPTLSAEEQMELVAENFVLIGFPDNEPTPVDFQAKGDMTIIDGGPVFTTRISWDVEIVNVSDGMDSTTGNFVAPKSGSHFFEPSGVSRLTSGDQEIKGTFAIQARLRFKKGDVATGSDKINKNALHFSMVKFIYN